MRRKALRRFWASGRRAGPVSKPLLESLLPNEVEADIAVFFALKNCRHLAVDRPFDANQLVVRVRHVSDVSEEDVRCDLLFDGQAGRRAPGDTGQLRVNLQPADAEKALQASRDRAGQSLTKKRPGAHLLEASGSAGTARGYGGLSRRAAGSEETDDIAKLQRRVGAVRHVQLIGGAGDCEDDLDAARLGAEIDVQNRFNSGWVVERHIALGDGVFVAEERQFAVRYIHASQ